MYLEDVCVRYYRAVWLTVSLSAIIMCDYSINDSLRGRFCPDTHHPTVLAAHRAPPVPPTGFHAVRRARTRCVSTSGVHVFMCVRVCL